MSGGWGHISWLHYQRAVRLRMGHISQLHCCPQQKINRAGSLPVRDKCHKHWSSPNLIQSIQRQIYLPAPSAPALAVIFTEVCHCQFSDPKVNLSEVQGMQNSHLCILSFYTSTSRFFKCSQVYQYLITQTLEANNFFFLKLLSTCVHLLLDLIILLKDVQ